MILNHPKCEAHMGLLNQFKWFSKRLRHVFSIQTTFPLISMKQKQIIYFSMNDADTVISNAFHKYVIYRYIGMMIQDLYKLFSSFSTVSLVLIYKFLFSTGETQKYKMNAANNRQTCVKMCLRYFRFHSKHLYTTVIIFITFFLNFRNENTWALVIDSFSLFSFVVKPFKRLTGTIIMLIHWKMKTERNDNRDYIIIIIASSIHSQQNNWKEKQCLNYNLLTQSEN